MKGEGHSKAWWVGGVLAVLFVGTLLLGRRAAIGTTPEVAPVEPSTAVPKKAPLVAGQRELSSGLGERPREGYPGVVLARDAVDLAPKVDGSLVAFHVHLGDRVARGAALASVDVASVRQDLRMAEARLRAAEADRAKAIAERNQAAEKRARDEGLIDQLSQAEIQNSRYQHQLTVAALNAAQARVAESEARVTQLREQVESGEIRAPFDGIVTERYLAPGARVSRQTPVLRLIGQSALSVRFAVPGEALGKLSSGTLVRVEIEQPELSLEGEVQSVSGELDPATQTLVAEARLNLHGETNIPSGQSARIFLVPPRRAERKR